MSIIRTTHAAYSDGTLIWTACLGTFGTKVWARSLASLDAKIRASGWIAREYHLYDGRHRRVAVIRYDIGAWLQELKNSRGSF